MSFLLMANDPTGRTSRRAFLGQSGLLLSGAAVALLAGKDALAATGAKSGSDDVRILNSALGAELEAIAASAIGGASLMGGKGSIFGTILGAIVLGAMRNGLTLLNVQAFYQLLATGIIIILAMLVDRLARGRG